MSGSQVQTLDLPQVKFWLDPLIPQGAIVLIHGKFGTAKTPILSNFAKSIVQGAEEVINCAITKASKCLFVQADTPKLVIVPRLKALGVDVEGLDFAFCYPGFNILEPMKDALDAFYYETLQNAHKINAYDIVFIDSLRAIHSADDKESTTVHQVYRALSKLFYGATIVLIHHDKKFSKDNASDETFSGSQAWVNHATVTLKFSHHNQKENEIKIEHTKTQASETIAPIIVKIGKDGINIMADSGSDKDAVEAFIQGLIDEGLGATEIDEKAAEEFAFSTRTARKRRRELEARAR